MAAPHRRPPPIAPKTVYEVHLLIRGALADAVRRGLVTSNVALLANAPRLRSIPKVEQKGWTVPQLAAFLQAAAGHRLFPAFWLAAMTGMRRNELLGLRWSDLDTEHARLSINRGLVAIGGTANVHSSRTRTNPAGSPFGETSSCPFSSDSGPLPRPRRSS